MIIKIYIDDQLAGAFTPQDSSIKPSNMILVVGEFITKIACSDDDEPDGYGYLPKIVALIDTNDPLFKGSIEILNRNKEGK